MNTSRSTIKRILSLQKPAITVLIFVVISLVIGVSFSEFYTKGEPREAMVAQAMLRDGEWVLPQVYGEEIAYKPPMMHWLIAAFSSVAGEVNEMTSRMPSAIAMVVMSLVFFVFVAHRRSFKEAYISTLLMVTSFELHRAAMTARVDMLLTAFIVLTLLALYRWEEQGLKGMPWWIALLIAGGILTKGPVALVLPLLIFGLYLLLTARYTWGEMLRQLFYLSVLSVLLPLLWYIAAWRVGGTDFLYIAGAENFMRFFHIAPSHLHYNLGHEAPAYRVIIYALVGFLPWTLLLCFSLFPKGYDIRGVWRERWTALRQRHPQPSSLHLFSWVVLVVTILFFMLPSSKRSVYILPIYPFFALLMAQHLMELIHKSRRSLIVFSTIISVLSCVVILAALVLMYGSEWLPLSEKNQQMVSVLGAGMKQYPWLTWSILCALCANVLMIVLQCRKRNFIKLAYANIMAMFLINLFIDGPVMIDFKQQHSARPFAQEVKAYLPAGEPIYVYNNLVEGFRNLYGTVFYLNQPVVDLHRGVGSSGHLLVWEQDLPQVQEKWKEQFTFEEVLRASDKIQEGGVALLVKFVPIAE